MPGAIHAHSALSDGGGTPAEVAAAARAAGLGFVVLTDHNSVEAKPFEGYHDGVLVLVGSELSTTKGHVLALGIPDPAFRFSGDARDVLEDIRDLGGFAFAAHPTSVREDFEWTGTDEPGPWGLEVLNGDSQWRLASWGKRAKAAAFYPLNQRYALLASLTAPTDALARWDELLARRDAVGIAGADAHGRLPLGKDRALPFPSYESVFALARNYVLLDRGLSGDGAVDGPAILQALARGRTYFGLDALAPADGFFFRIEGSGGRRWTMGETVAPESGLRLRAGGRLPSGARLSLLRDGRAMAQSEGLLEVAVPGPGVYRIEVHVRGWDPPWVVSNPIAVVDARQAAARQAAAAWPPEPPPPASRRVLEDFNRGSVFVPNKDAASRLGEAAVDPAGGTGGTPAGRLDFELGQPTPQHPDVFCALVDWSKRDLSGHIGLVFSVRADGVYRLWFQVRDENPASRDDATENWFASVKTSPEWRRVAIPFARLRSINPRTDGSLDLARVKGIVFVLDKGSVKPGTRGQIRIDDVALY